MSNYGMKTVDFGLKYHPMDIEKRRSLLPYKNVCSLYPAKADEDVLVTANGRQRLDIIGDPYHERVIYRRERIMDMRWKDKLRWAPFSDNHGLQNLQAEPHERFH